MSNATSLKEARKSTRLNQYVLIFTIVTIIYLPLGFVTVSIRFQSAVERVVNICNTASNNGRMTGLLRHE